MDKPKEDQLELPPAGPDKRNLEQRVRDDMREEIRRDPELMQAYLRNVRNRVDPLALLANERPGDQETYGPTLPGTELEQLAEESAGDNGLPWPRKKTNWYAIDKPPISLAEETKRMMRLSTPAQPAAVPRKVGGKQRTGAKPMFPKRAAWLTSELHKRVKPGGKRWNVHELERHGGPEHRIGQKILDGESVGNDVLRKVAMALSAKPVKGEPEIKISDIPND